MALFIYFIILFMFVFRFGSSVYETHQNIEIAGYVAETHHVVTEDGYILEIHRIPFRRNESSGLADRPVVFLMHGLLAASNSYIILGRHYAISYNLADAGFDVWMGNARGSRNSRHHISLDPDMNQLEFFDFTWNEIGMYDVTAMIDYILEYTGNQKLHYIGHSQGGTSFLVMTSTRPEYNEKIASAHLLAPAGYKTHFPNVILRTLARFTNILWSLAVNMGILEVIPPNTLLPFTEGAQNEGLRVELWQYCAGDTKLKDFCIMTGVKEIMENTFADNSTASLGFGGASLKQIAHYGQNIKDDSFRKWDYGIPGNMAQYGTIEPPIYNLSLITVDVTIHYTVGDTLVNERDIYAMAKDMSRTKVRRVARESFSHADFMFANDVRDLVTVYVIDAINNHNSADIDPEITVPEADSSSTIVLSFFMKFYLFTFIMYCVL